MNGWKNWIDKCRAFFVSPKQKFGFSVQVFSGSVTNRNLSDISWHGEVKCNRLPSLIFKSFKVNLLPLTCTYQSTGELYDHDMESNPIVNNRRDAQAKGQLCCCP